MRRAIHPFPNTPSWRGAQLKAQGLLYLRRFHGLSCIYVCQWRA